MIYIDDFGQRIRAHGVGPVAVVAVGRQPAHAYQRHGKALGQVYPVAALVFRGAFIGERGIEVRLKAAAVDGQFNHVINAVPDLVTVGFDFPDLWP